MPTMPRNLACRVKFGAFFEYLEKAHPGRFDRIASGHYAAVAHGPQGAVLSAAADPVKDQTYFLAHLSQVQPMLVRCWSPTWCRVYPVTT